MLSQISSGLEMTSARVDALSWACRFLPFSGFLSVEEMLQDLLLSLLSELPSLSQVKTHFSKHLLLVCPGVTLSLIVFFSGGRHTGESFPRGRRVSQSPIERKVQVTAAESEAMQRPWYEHGTSHFSVSIKTAAFLLDDVFLSRFRTFRMWKH